MLSHRLKGKWSLRRRQSFHSTLSVLLNLRRHSTSLSNWYNLSLIFHLPMGENIKGLSTSLFLAIHAKGGEILSPKQKDRTTNFKKIRKDDLFCFHKSLVSNWYLVIAISSIGVLISIGIFKNRFSKLVSKYTFNW
jgi:hypothetical protein